MKPKIIRHLALLAMVVINSVQTHAASILLDGNATAASSYGALQLDLRQFNVLHEYPNGSRLGQVQPKTFRLAKGDSVSGFTTIVRVVSQFPHNDSRFVPVTLSYIGKPAVRAGVSTSAQNQVDPLTGGTANANQPWESVTVEELNSQLALLPNLDPGVKIQISRGETLYLKITGRFNSSQTISSDGDFIAYVYPNFWDRNDITAYAVRYQTDVALSLTVNRGPAPGTIPPLEISVSKGDDGVTACVPLGYKGTFFLAPPTGKFRQLGCITPPATCITFEPTNNTGRIKFVGYWAGKPRGKCTTVSTTY